MGLIVCPKCSYVWEYRGTSDYPCCPKCLRKFRLPPVERDRLKLVKDVISRMYSDDALNVRYALKHLGEEGFPKNLEEFLKAFRVTFRKYTTRDEAKILGLWEVCRFCNYVWLPNQPQAIKCPKCKRVVV